MRVGVPGWSGLVALAMALPAHAGTVQVKTEDQRSLSAEHAGSGARGVLLVHDAGRTRADWSSFTKRLGDNGFQVLALDLRGHGASREAEPTLTDASWTAMTADVAAGASWLRSHGSDRVTVVGASFGANLALAAAADGGIDAVVLLSPAVTSHGVSLVQPVATFEGPTLFVADAGEKAGARAATLLSEKAAGETTLELVGAGAAGHRMLNTVPELEALVVGWVHGARGEGPALASPDRTLEAGDIDKIETTGEEYGAKR